MMNPQPLNMNGTSTENGTHNQHHVMEFAEMNFTVKQLQVKNSNMNSAEKQCQILRVVLCLI
jgi:hypothetical protein